MNAGIIFALGKGAWKLVSSKPVRLALARYILDSVEKHDSGRPSYGPSSVETGELTGPQSPADPDKQ